MMLAPATTIVQVVSPSLNTDGRKAYSTRGQLFDGKVDGRTVVKRSPTPFCAAARVLLAEGVDPATKLVMRHEGSSHDALRSTVGAAAKITVADSSTGKPVFVPWVDLRETYGSAARSGPPIRETDSAATLCAQDGRASTGGRPITGSSILAWRQVYGDRAAHHARERHRRVPDPNSGVPRGGVTRLRMRAAWAASISVLVIAFIFEPNKVVARVIPPSPENASASDLDIVGIDESSYKVALSENGRAAFKTDSASARPSYLLQN